MEAPDRENVFELEIAVAADDIDQLGHVNNVVFLRYAQEVATAHWMSAATPEQIRDLVWVARRHEIDYLRPATRDDRLVARTWVGAASGATFERFVEIRNEADDGVLARIRTVWVALNALTRRPRRVPDGLRARFRAGMDGGSTTDRPD